MFSEKVKQLTIRFKNKIPNSNFKRWERHTFDLLVLETNFLPENSSVSQRLWHIEQNTNQIPACSICKKNKVSWNRMKHQYRLFCGAKCIAQSKETKEKRKQTMIEKYNVPFYTQASDFNKKRKKTYKEKYGFEWAVQSPDIQAKIKITNIKKYGSSVYVKSNDYKNKFEKWLKKFNLVSTSQIRISPESLEYLNDKNWLYEQHHIKQKTITKIAQELDVDGTTVVDRLDKFSIPILRFEMSQGHMDLVDEIKKFYKNSIQTNVRNILPSKKELDIYIPEFNLAIEYCGLYWHSSDKRTRIARDYHKQKYIECSKNGIKLLTIFEDEWFDKRNIVLSTIKQHLKINKNSIGARETIIKELSYQEAKSFLERYHIQGNGPGSLNIGLYDDKNNLVAVGKFIKQKKQLILNRYATSKNVQGGFSKIIKYIRKQNTLPIITFADLRWSEGNLYRQVGFTLEKNLPPDYTYVNIKLNKRIHKFNLRHSRLSRMLPNYNPNETEVQNCLKSGLFRIWDCGKIKFVLK